MLVVLFALPASAHTRGELDEWRADWVARADESLSPDLMEEWDDMRERHPSYFAPQLVISRDAFVIRHDVEQWRELVSVYWGEDTEQALCIISHESGGNANAKNPKSSARGLFQILGSLWAPHFGVSYEALYDPELNVCLAREIYLVQGWGAWSPYNRGLCH